MNSKIFKAVFFSTLFILVLSLACVLWLAHSLMMKNNESMLSDYTNALVHDIDAYGSYYIKGLNHGSFRVSLIDPTGKVYFDSTVNVERLASHKDRTEFVNALKYGKSSIERYSETLDTETVYHAVRLKSGDVLRTAFTTENVLSLTKSLIFYLCCVVLFAAVLSAFIAFKLSRSIVKPINAIDLNAPLANDVYDELSPLLRRIDSHQKHINDLIKTISEQARKMQAITTSMTEGLILFNAQGEIISVNNSAKKIFNIDNSFVGKSILTVDRSLSIRKFFDKGDDLNNKVEDFDKDGHYYRVFFSKIDTKEDHVGYTLLVIDVTQKRIAEMQRQEFTANVSHELKTPLQSIIGRAELLENNLVSEKDVVPFAQRIRKEGENLLALINDIILLSKLDEGGSLENEEIDLNHVVAGIKESLEDKCRDLCVSISVTGSVPKIYAVFRYFNQLLFNLCDNAVKYNNPGGTVAVSLEELDDNIIIKVSDNGIGIPKDAIGRVFERFFCVDKSHTKSRVGTGLGLSIVKHIVKLYNGTIKLDSEVGIGSTFTVTFPKKALEKPQQRSL